MSPWRRYEEIALGVLGMAPDDFWAMTPPEFRAAFDGWLEVHGPRGRAAAPPLREELEEMMHRFPY